MDHYRKYCKLLIHFEGINIKLSNFILRQLLLLLAAIIFTSGISAQDVSILSKINKVNGIDKVELLNQYAASFRRKLPKERLRYSKLALLEAHKLDYKKGIADALNNYGMSYYHLGQFQKAIVNYKMAFPLFEKLNDTNAMGGTYNNIANAYEKLGEIDSAIIYHSNALKIRESSGSKDVTATSITNLGLLNLKIGKFTEALSLFQKALQLRKEIGNKIPIAASLNNIGSLYWQWGNFNTALEYYKKSLSMNQTAQYKEGEIISKLNIGLINIDLGAFDFANQYINSGIIESRNIKFEKGKAIGYYYLAILYNKQRFKDSSLTYIKLSIPYFQKVNDYNALSKLFILTAEIFISKKLFNKTQVALNKALEKAKASKDKTLTAAAFQVKGKLEIEKHNFSAALKYTKESMQLNEHARQREKIVENLWQLSLIYMKTGEYRKAVEHYKLYEKQKDSLFNQKLIGNITNWRVKYETAKKENEILKLQEQNAGQLSELGKQLTLRNLFIAISVVVLFLLIVLFYLYNQRKKMIQEIRFKNKQLDDVNEKLEKQNKKLEISNSTKDKLFSIVAHDLRSPFTALLGLSSYLDSNIEEMDRKEIINASKSIYTTSEKLLKLTKNLLEWARMQISSIEPNPELLKVNDIINECVGTIKPAAEQKGIALICSVKENLSVYCDRHLLDTILRNLISNSVKFTNPGGEVSLIVYNEGNRIYFKIKDTGIGMEPETLDQVLKTDELLSTTGTNGEKGTGLGIKICKEMVIMSGGELTALSSVGKGTEFIFYLPVNKKE